MYRGAFVAQGSIVGREKRVGLSGPFLFGLSVKPRVCRQDDSAENEQESGGMYPGHRLAKEQVRLDAAECGQ